GKRRRRRFTVAAVAAACIVVFGFGWIFTPVTVTTPPGEQQVVELPDGSAVEMNSATTLQRSRLFAAVPVWLGGGRSILLEGEAYFRVVPSDDPFVVETNDAIVEVLGTEFNVRARNTLDEAGTAVTLADGRVRISSRSTTDSVSSAPSPTSVVLSKAGDAAHVKSSGTVTRTDGSDGSSLDHALAWRSSGFAAIDLPLRSVLDEMEHRYDIEIFPREGVDVRAPINVFYLRGAEPEQILRDICLSQSCGYRETSRGYALVDRGSASTDDDLISATPDSSN
ncbi:MAG: FecR domain-containing protein, partial [Rhodothermales bacterium]